MSNDGLNRTDGSSKVDLTSAVVSNLAVIIQIVAVGATGLANVLKVNEIFEYQDLVTLANFLVLLLSFSFIGLYNFNKSNKNFISNEINNQGLLTKIKKFILGQQPASPFDNRSEKSLLNFLFFVLVVSTFTFFYFTYKSYTTEPELMIWEGVIQLATYILSLVLSSILIYIWISDSFDKSNRFTESNYIPNIKASFIEYGHIQTKPIVIYQNIKLDNGNRLIVVTFEENVKRFFISNFDGNVILAEITEDQYSGLLNQSA